MGGFFSPVIEALVARQRIIESKQEGEQRQQRIEQEQQRIAQHEKELQQRVKQFEAVQKIRNLEAGVLVKNIIDAEKAQLTGSLEGPATKPIPGVSPNPVQTQPLLNNILQQQYGMQGIPEQDIFVRGQENAPVNLNIPGFGGEAGTQLPLGNVRELAQQRAFIEQNRQAEQERQLRLTGQEELLKSRARAAGKSPFDIQLTERRGQISAEAQERLFAHQQKLADERNAVITRNAAMRRATTVQGGDPEGISLLAGDTIAGNAQAIPRGGKDLSNLRKAVKEVGSEMGIPNAIPVFKEQKAEFRNLQRITTSLNKWVNFLQTLDPDENLVKQAAKSGWESALNAVGLSELGILTEELNADVAFYNRTKTGESRMSDFDAKVQLGEFLRVGLRSSDGKRRINNILDLVRGDAKTIVSGISDEQLDIVVPGFREALKNLESFVGNPEKSAPTSSGIILSSDGKTVTFNEKKYDIGKVFEAKGKKLIFRVVNGKPKLFEVK